MSKKVKILDVQIQVNTDNNVAMVSSGAMQCDFPIKRMAVGENMQSLFLEWLGQIEEGRSCLLCQHGKFWHEDGNPCWDCSRFEHLEDGADPEFRQFYSDAMDNGWEPETIGSLCPHFAVLQQPADEDEGISTAEKAFYDTLPGFLKPQSE